VDGAGHVGLNRPTGATQNGKNDKGRQARKSSCGGRNGRELPHGRKNERRGETLKDNRERGGESAKAAKG